MMGSHRLPRKKRCATGADSWIDSALVCLLHGGIFISLRKGGESIGYYTF